MKRTTTSRQIQRRLIALTALMGACSLFTADTAFADWYDTTKQAVAEGSTAFDFRYRYEFVDSVPFDKNANASTLRSRITWVSGAIGAWTAGVEADYVSAIGPERYNSLANGKTQYPVVADPTGFDLNRAYLQFATEDTTGIFGRQRINHGNQRFVGGVAWRQNEQTFDSLRLEFGNAVKLDYAYVFQVNRVFGPDGGIQPATWDANTHLFRAIVGLAPNHTLTAYGYLMDFEGQFGPINSNETLGVHYDGRFGPLKLAAAFARQADYKDNPIHYDANYYFVDGALTLLATDSGSLSANVGYEVLGSDDGNAGFRTPLATLHKFQGWADQFLNTPLTGVRDAYVGLGGKFRKLGLSATYHDFRADSGGADYGSEIDLMAEYPLKPDALTLQLKYADYNADEFAFDTRKFWVTLQLKL